MNQLNRAFNYLTVICLICVVSVSITYAYDKNADPKIDYLQSIKSAQQSGKLVLIVFGANWCKDCKAFDKQIKRKLKEVIKANYELVKVDVGNFDRNLDFVSKFGNPISNGIPSIVIVNNEKTILFATKAGEFASMRNIDEDSLLDFFIAMSSKLKK